MRKSTMMWLSLAALSGVLLFHTSQKVTDGRQALYKMNREIAKEEESLRVMQAEWSYLNQPERIEKLADEYLHLVPLKGRQFAKIEDINKPLPKTDPALLPDAPDADDEDMSSGASVSDDDNPAPTVAVKDESASPLARTAAPTTPEKTLAAKPPVPAPKIAAAAPAIPAMTPADKMAINALITQTAPQKEEGPRIVRPASAAAPAATAAPKKDFSDVMKNLGVH